MHPFLEGLRPTLHISHRGGALLYPENTLFAFEQAVRLHRTQMLELDVQLTRDGELVVTHDDTVDRCTDGEGDVHRLSLSEVQALDAGYRFTPDGGRTYPFRGKGIRIPLLAEVLAAFPGLRLNVELKRDLPGAVEGFARVIRQAGAEARVCVGAVDDDLAQRLHQALPDACHFYPVGALTAFVMAARQGEPVPRDDRFWVLDMPLEYEGMRLVDPSFLRIARAHGRWVNVWTIDDPVQMRRLVSEGVGGVMTDRPDLLREVLNRT